MEQSWKWLKWILGAGGAISTLLIAATQVSEQQGTSNLASWAKWLGLANFAPILRGPIADRWGLILGVLLLVSVLGIFGLHRWSRARHKVALIESREWIGLAQAVTQFCNPEFVSIRDRYSNTFQETLARYREIEVEMQKVSEGGWKDRPEALEKYNELRGVWERLGAVGTAAEKALRDIWAVLRDELTQLFISGELIARGFAEPRTVGGSETEIKASEWRILEPNPYTGAATKKGDASSIIYSGLEVARSSLSPSNALSLASGSPLEIIFDPRNPQRRFWSIEQTHDETAKPIAGHTWWEYRVLIRNKSTKTVRNVKATVEAIGPMPTRPEPSYFDINKQQLIDLNPLDETLALLRRWFNPSIVAGMVIGGAYGPIKITVSADDVLPVSKFFHFEPENTPMISEILW